MREIVFRNLTSGDRRKRVIATSEISEKEGVRSFIRRHFIYVIKEVQDTSVHLEPEIQIVKERSNSRQMERFCCKIKSGAYATYKGKLYLVAFVHSLSITLTALHEGSAV